MFTTSACDVLQVKLLEGQAQGCRVADFLAKAVEPPAQAAITGAVQLLEDIGALEPDTEALTVLGRHLAALPLPPRVGKMLLYGLLFGCLDPVLTVACCMAYRWAGRLATLMHLVACSALVGPAAMTSLPYA